MATAPVKSQQPLHYFSLSHLKWGQKTSHRFRRRDSPATPPPQPGSSSPCSSHKQQQVQQEEEQQQEEEKVLWNLRPRKGVDNKTAPLKENAVEMGVENNHVQRSQRIKGNGDGHRVGSGKERLWISLSKEEIEEDVYSMTGSRPSKRPKKRSKTVQKQLDNAFPGLYLVGLNSDAFKVPDTTK